MAVLENDFQPCIAQKIYFKHKMNLILRPKPRRRKTKSRRGKRWQPILNCADDAELRLYGLVGTLARNEEKIQPGQPSLRTEKGASTAILQKEIFDRKHQFCGFLAPSMCLDLARFMLRL